MKAQRAEVDAASMYAAQVHRNVSLGGMIPQSYSDPRIDEPSSLTVTTVPKLVLNCVLQNITMNLFKHSRNPQRELDRKYLPYFPEGLRIVKIRVRWPSGTNRGASNQSLARRRNTTWRRHQVYRGHNHEAGQTRP